MLHFDAAYNFARWLTQEPYDADDVMQESLLRAFIYFGTFDGSDPKAWLLAIVRNTYYSWLRKNRIHRLTTVFDDEVHPEHYKSASPEELHIQNSRSEELRNCIDSLPVSFREIIVLREMKGLSYRNIADATGLPMGTVMSRLSRARRRLQDEMVNSQGTVAPVTNSSPNLDQGKQRQLEHRRALDSLRKLDHCPATCENARSVSTK